MEVVRVELLPAVGGGAQAAALLWSVCIICITIVQKAFYAVLSGA